MNEPTKFYKRMLTYWRHHISHEATAKALALAAVSGSSRNYDALKRQARDGWRAQG